MRAKTKSLETLQTLMMNQYVGDIYWTLEYSYAHEQVLMQLFYAQLYHLDAQRYNECHYTLLCRGNFVILEDI